MSHHANSTDAAPEYLCDILVATAKESNLLTLVGTLVNLGQGHGGLCKFYKVGSLAVAK